MQRDPGGRILERHVIAMNGDVVQIGDPGDESNPRCIEEVVGAGIGVLILLVADPAAIGSELQGAIIVEAGVRRPGYSKKLTTAHRPVISTGGGTPSVERGVALDRVTALCAADRGALPLHASVRTQKTSGRVTTPILYVLCVTLSSRVGQACQGIQPDCNRSSNRSHSRTAPLARS